VVGRRGSSRERETGERIAKGLMQKKMTISHYPVHKRYEQPDTPKKNGDREDEDKRIKNKTSNQNKTSSRTKGIRT